MLSRSKFKPLRAVVQLKPAIVTFVTWLRDSHVGIFTRKNSYAKEAAAWRGDTKD